MKQPESSKRAAKMYELAAFISAHADSSLSLSSLAKKADLSPSHLQRIFKAFIGVSPKEYQDAERLKQFKSRLREGQNITQATFDAGYGSTSRIHDRIDGGASGVYWPADALIVDDSSGNRDHVVAQQW